MPATCLTIYAGISTLKNTKFLDLGFHKEEDDYLGLYLPYGDNIIIPLIEKVVFAIIKGINASV